MKIPTHHNSLLSMNVIEEEMNEKKIISLGEIIPIVNMNHVNIDLLSGIYTTKNIKQFDLYKVIDIEYEYYDSLMMMNTSCKQILKASRDNAINAYFIEGKGVTSYEIVAFNTNIEDSFHLPIHLFNFFNNHIISYSNYGRISNPFCSIKKCYSSTYKLIKETIISNNINCISIIASFQSSVAYMFNCISDKLGYIFFKKDLDHFTSKEQLLTYIKKKEFKSPCLVLFSNIDRVKWLKNNDTIDSLKPIIYIKRNSINRTLSSFIFVFHFQYESSITSTMSKLFQKQIVISHLSLEQKKTLLICGIDNYTKYADTLLRNNRLLQLNLTPVFKRVNSCQIKITSNIEKIIISLSIKDIKSSIKLFFIQLLNDISESKYEHILLEAMKLMKNQKLNQDERLVSTIPEIKWNDIGGLDNIKEEIYDIINLPMKYSHLFNSKINIHDIIYL